MSTNEKINILKDVLGQPNKEGNKQFLFYCPKCEHHKKKLSINMEKGYFKCWICDWSGRNLYRVIKNYGNYQQKQSWRKLTQQTEINNFAEKLFGTAQLPPEEKIYLPKNFVSLVNKSSSSTSIRPKNYLRSRGISIEDIYRWKIGYCYKGKFSGRIIIPSFDMNGNLKYFIGR